MTKRENFRWGRLARRLGVALVVAYMCSAVVLVAGEEVMTRWHDRGAVMNGSWTDVWLRTEDGVRIYARYYARDPALPTLLYFHCHQRGRRVPLSAASPVPRDPPVGAETLLYCAA